MLNVKVMTKLSNKRLDMMLELLTNVLPKGNLIPRSTYEAKKILRDLGMSYEHIDACKNDCALFWKENENLDKCPKKSRKNSENRNKTSSKHICGTKALVVRVDEEENIFKVQVDHCQAPNAIPLTQEEISNLVFKKKSGILKVLSMRTSSSLVTTVSSNSSVEYIQRFKNEIIELKEARARDQEERAKDQKE
ncbi:hypothetical protein SO802_013773 [Lithocarpus litseifolius]|uniref:Uncharacterized protein n=1 Tax=Lithocarpus litseifolius TaxID=425828 RepID=A0AAW2D8P1_9ROSI